MALRRAGVRHGAQGVTVATITDGKVVEADAMRDPRAKPVTESTPAFRGTAGIGVANDDGPGNDGAAG